MKKSFFFSHKHFINVQSWCFLVLRLDSVEWMELINQCLFCLIKHVFCIADRISYSSDLLGDLLLRFWELVSLPGKWVTYFLNSFSYMSSFPIHNNIYAFLVLLELLIFQNSEFIRNNDRFSFSRSENKSLQSKKISLINNSSNFVEIGFVLILNESSILITTSSTIFNVIVIVPSHSLKSLLNFTRIQGRCKNLKTVCEGWKRVFCFFYLLVLVLNEIFLAFYVSKYFIKQQIRGFLFNIADILQILKKSLNRCRLIQFDSIFLALFHKVRDHSLWFFALFDMRCVRKIVWRLFSVQINEVWLPERPKIIHHRLSIIFRNCQLVQFHYFRSIESIFS